MKKNRTLAPVNQKSVYHSFSNIYESLMNDEISIEKAEACTSALQGMNRTYALELKRTEVEFLITGQAQTVEMRNIESKGFENTVSK